MNVNQIWIGKLENINPNELAYMDSVRSWCKRFGHKYKLWLSEDIKELLTKFNLPFREDCHPVTLTDAGRVCALIDSGGIYMDNDVEIRDQEKWESYISEFPKDKLGYQQFRIKWYWYCQGVLYSAPDNLLLHRLLDMVSDYYPNMNVGDADMEYWTLCLLKRLEQEREIFCQGFSFESVGFCDKNAYITHWHLASWGNGTNPKTGDPIRNRSLHL